MGVNADVVAGDCFHHFADDRFDFMRQRTAIGVAQHDPARAFGVSGFRALKRILRIGFVTVEEMLAVEQHFTAFSLRRFHAVADRGEVFLVGRLQSDAHMVVPGLGDKTNRVGLGLKQRRQTGIVRRRAARSPRHAKGGEFRVETVVAAKQFRVDRIGAGIAAFDIVDAKPVEHAGNRQLVGQREIDAIGLRAVAQRGVEQIEAFLSHGLPKVIIREQSDTDNDRNDGHHDMVAFQFHPYVIR